MKRQHAYITLALVAVALWALVVWFVNSIYPSNWTPVLFLVSTAAATSATIAPISLWATYNWGTTHGIRTDLTRALRHGTLAGGLLAALLGLRILRLFSLPTVLLLIAVFVAIEIIVQLRLN